jgi:hypothetical protein
MPSAARQQAAAPNSFLAALAASTDDIYEKPTDRRSARIDSPLSRPARGLLRASVKHHTHIHTRETT